MTMIFNYMLMNMGGAELRVVCLLDRERSAVAVVSAASETGATTTDDSSSIEFQNSL